MAQGLLHFFFGQDSGQAFWLSGAQGVDGTQILVEHLFVEKEQGAQGLVLGGGGDVSPHGHEGQECFYCSGAHVGRVAHIVEKDVAFDSEGSPPALAGVGLLGADRVVLALSCTSTGDSTAGG
jgi:hypothetical protein